MSSIKIGFLLIASVACNLAHASSFNEVRDVLLDQDVPVKSQAAAEELSVYRAGKLPQYEVNFTSVFKNGSEQLELDAKRTIDDNSDYFDRLPKLLHPNGVCVLGTWKMNQDSPFTGAFSAGREQLFIGRISVAMEETTAGNKRGFGFAGKIFSTMYEDTQARTENFFTVDVLMGTKIGSFLQTSVTNEPEVGFDVWSIPLGLKIASALKKADMNPGFRPVRNLALMNETNRAIRYPKWIRISADPNLKQNDQADFRHEVLQAVAENQDLTFYVDGSDLTKDRSAEHGWVRLGEIKISEAVVSYGCDRRLHFTHPTLKP